MSLLCLIHLNLVSFNMLKWTIGGWMTCNLGLIWTRRCPFCPDLLSPPSAVAWPAPLLRLFLHFTFGGRVLHSCVTVWLIKSVHRHLNTWQSAAKKRFIFPKGLFFLLWNGVSWTTFSRDDTNSSHAAAAATKPWKCLSPSLNRCAGRLWRLGRARYSSNLFRYT